LRNILRYRVEYPSLLSRGPEAFLKAVEAANARQKDVLLIPGTEVIPHYYWTGELFGQTLTMYNAQKNLLALGLSRAEDYRGIPAVGGTDCWPTIWADAGLPPPGPLEKRPITEKNRRRSDLAKSRPLFWPSGRMPQACSAPLRVEARLIRSGAIVHTVKGETPFAFIWQETALQPSARVYYRLEVLGPGGHQILANPIFVTVSG